jgi:hypothetical protein
MATLVLGSPPVSMAKVAVVVAGADVADLTVVPVGFETVDLVTGFEVSSPFALPGCHR